MKIAMTALAVVLLAGAAPAMAQPGQHGNRGGERAQHDWGGGRHAQRAPRAAEAPQAPAAPRADQPRAFERHRGRDVAQENRGRNWRGGGNDGWRQHRNGGERVRAEGARSYRDGGAPQTAPRHDRERRDWSGDRQAQRDWSRDRQVQRDWSREREDRRDWDRDRDRDRRGHYDRDRDHRDRYDRNRYDGRRGERWSRGRYPSVYFSSHRYRHSWRPPPGYYVRAWSYGDFLPRAWFGPDWWLGDPWDYGLPLPPPGFDWVRVGDDALLVDQFTGEIVQIVRDVFW
jgi:hypothetical protein